MQPEKTRNAAPMDRAMELPGALRIGRVFTRISPPAWSKPGKFKDKLTRGIDATIDGSQSPRFTKRLSNRGENFKQTAVPNIGVGRFPPGHRRVLKGVSIKKRAFGARSSRTTRRGMPRGWRFQHWAAIRS